MNILTNWLRHYLPALPVTDRQLADDLTLRGIAVEGVHSLGPGNGHLFEMDITTNRVDAMNHYGIAREAATIYNLPLAPLESPQEPVILTLSESKGKNPRISSEAPQSSIPQSFPVTIEAPTLCGRFTAQVLRDVTIAPSTGQVAEYFNLLGQKQISNAVDASNFVLLGMGHPTHAFDLDKLEGGIIVRLARKGEKLKLLDGTERILEPDDLVIADQKKALGLAGVMGGWDTMITAETKNILIEAAWFDPVSIRRSSRRHGLHTDASHRFERGADFNAAPIANALVSNLILRHGGHAEGALIDVIIPQVAARTASRPPIQLSVQQVQRHLGATLEDTPTTSALTPDLIHQYLTALGCTLTSAPNRIATESGAPSSRPLLGAKVGHRAEHDPSLGLAEGFGPLNTDPSERGFSPGPSSTPDTIFSVQLPSWRLDLEREIDLIEEVARVYGYNRFANTLATALPVIAHPTAAKEAAVRTRLLALGYSESISSTFASHHDADLFHIPPTNPNIPTENAGAPYVAASSPRVGIRESEPPSSNAARTVPMENPLSEEASLLRPSLIPGMLNMLAHNLNRDVKDVRLFEQGQIFTATVFADSSIVDAVHESPQLSLGLTGSPTTTDRYTAQAPLFFELKGAIESVISLFDLTPSTQTKESSFRPEAAHFAAAVEKSAVSSPTPKPLTFTAESPAWLQPGRSATAFVNNQPIAHFGELSASEIQKRKLRQPAYLAQLDLAKLYEFPLKKVTARDLSRFQAVERDFSFVFPDATQWHTIASAIHALAISELQSFKPIEIWRNAKFPGVYSLLLRTVFQSHDRTLRDDELTTWSSALIDTLTKLGGTLRAAGEK
jgi:phenylalanyl-tRNA synthetase beta chain